MPVIYGTVAAPSTISAADGTNITALQGKAGELVVTELHGPYYTECYRGNVFVGSTPMAGAPVTSATSTSLTALTLWNPQGSGKNLELISLDLLELATIGVGGLGLSYMTALGANVGTGAPVISGTFISAINTNLGAANTSIAKLGTTISVTAAPVLFMNLGMGTQSSTAGTGAYLQHYDFAGRVIVAPGTAVTLTAAAATTVAASMIWVEIPV